MPHGFQDATIKTMAVQVADATLPSSDDREAIRIFEKSTPTGSDWRRHAEQFWFDLFVGCVEPLANITWRSDRTSSAADERRQVAWTCRPMMPSLASSAPWARRPQKSPFFTAIV